MSETPRTILSAEDREELLSADNSKDSREKRKGLLAKIQTSMREEPGIDHAQSLLELSKVWTATEIAEFCGFSGRGALRSVATGARGPSHKAGEAIYILYVETFGKKPPAK